MVILSFQSVYDQTVPNLNTKASVIGYRFGRIKKYRTESFRHLLDFVDFFPNRKMKLKDCHIKIK